jgi:hypothetical protein
MKKMAAHSPTSPVLLGNTGFKTPFSQKSKGIFQQFSHASKRGW